MLSYIDTPFGKCRYSNAYLHACDYVDSGTFKRIQINYASSFRTTFEFVEFVFFSFWTSFTHQSRQQYNLISGFIGDKPFNICRGVPKNGKNIVCRRQQLETNCLQIVCPKNCLHGTFKDCSKDAFLLQVTRQHSIAFWYKFQSVHISFMRHIIITVFRLTVIID